MGCITLVMVSFGQKQNEIVMEINYGDTIETIRDERGIVIGFDETGYIIVRIDANSIAYINPKHVDLVQHAED